MRRIATIFASVLLLAGTTAACGDDSDARAGDPASPTQSTSESTDPSASVDPSESAEPSESTAPSESPSESTSPAASEFCTAATAEGFSTGGFKEIKTWADGLRQVPPPSDLTTDQLAGLELLVGMVEKSKTEDELNATGKKFSAKEQKQVQAFVTYVGTACR